MTTDLNTTKIVSEVREYLLANFNGSLNFTGIANALTIKREHLQQIFQSEEGLLETIINLERNSIRDYFNNISVSDLNALDTLIVVGQEVFDRFQHISPVILINLKANYPKQFETIVKPYLIEVSILLEKNLLKGIDEGVYRTDLDSTKAAKSFMTELLQYHESVNSTFVHFSFGMIFSNLFETFINNITTEEGWLYFTRRRQFIEALDFGHIQ